MESSHWRSALSTERSATSASGDSTAFKRSCIPFEKFELNRSRTTRFNRDNRALNTILRMPRSPVPAGPCFGCIRSSTEMVFGRDPRKPKQVMNSAGSTENRIIPGDTRLARVEAAEADKRSLPGATARLFRVRQLFWSLKFLSVLSDGRGQLGAAARVHHRNLIETFPLSFSSCLPLVVGRRILVSVRRV
jgi:hypothetical protein